MSKRHKNALYRPWNEVNPPVAETGTSQANETSIGGTWERDLSQRNQTTDEPVRTVSKQSSIQDIAGLLGTGLFTREGHINFRIIAVLVALIGCGWLFVQDNAANRLLDLQGIQVLLLKCGALVTGVASILVLYKIGKALEPLWSGGWFGSFRNWLRSTFTTKGWVRPVLWLASVLIAFFLGRVLWK